MSDIRNEADQSKENVDSEATREALAIVESSNEQSPEDASKSTSDHEDGEETEAVYGLEDSSLPNPKYKDTVIGLAKINRNRKNCLRYNRRPSLH
jgi:hypothetical protein